MALLIIHGYSSALPFSSNGIMLDQADFVEAKSSQIEHDMQVQRHEAKDVTSIG